VTETSLDTWPRDVAILQRIVATLDARPDRVITFSEIGLGTTAHQGQTYGTEDVKRAVRKLHDGGLVHAVWIDESRSPGGQSFVQSCTRAGYEKAGAWPTPETAVDRLIAALEHIAENTEDDEERTRLQQFAVFLKTSGTQVGLNVVTAFLTRQVT
jgi:hypothetical protein